MSEILSPGVFIEEKPATLQVVGPVSTSTLGIVGFTEQGPSDEATLVTSFEQFVSVFGPQNKNSFMYLAMAAYYANGGRRAYVSRVVPSDAIAADAKVLSNHDDQTGVGTGVAVAFDSGAGPLNLTALKADPAYPIRGTSIVLRWRGLAAAPVGPINTKVRATPATTLQTVIGFLRYEGRLDPAAASLAGFFTGSSLPVDPDLFITGASLVLSWDASGVPKTLTLATGTGAILTGTNGAGSTGTYDRRTGIFSILLDVSEAPTTTDPIVSTFTPAVDFTATADNAGLLTSSGLTVATKEVNLTTGRIRFTTTAAGTPLVGSPIRVAYTIEAWDLNPVSKGSWANKLRVVLSGNTDFYDAATATFSKFNMNVFLTDGTGASVLKEVFEELDLSDPASDTYFPDVINDLSDFVSVTAGGADEPPGQLNGIARSTSIAGGVAASPIVAITSSVGKLPVKPRTVTITYVDNATSATKTITDDGKGALVGDVSGATNTINYATGAAVFTPATIVKAGTLITAAYRSSAVETSHTEQFGDTTKSYTVGSNGTFSSGTYGRDQISAPALISDYMGLYALNRVEELLQVAVPDFAGDLVITGDLLDYADTRASQPSGGDRFVILTVPKGSSAQDAVDWLRFELGRYSKFAALYWPWIKVADPLSKNRPLVMPPLGHIAGIYARTDSQRNVAKAPAGTTDGALNFLLGLETNPTQGERDLVYPNKINPLLFTPQTGNVVWGCRTISNDSQWRYVSVRRLFMFLEKSVYNATWWIPFENNGPALWAKITAQLNSFLLAQFNAGLLAGSSPAQAFSVVCDGTNNTAATIELGQVNVDVSVAPFKPAEFVTFRFAQIAQT